MEVETLYDCESIMQFLNWNTIPSASGHTHRPEERVNSGAATVVREAPQWHHATRHVGQPSYRHDAPWRPPRHIKEDSLRPSPGGCGGNRAQCVAMFYRIPPWVRSIIHLRLLVITVVYSQLKITFHWRKQLKKISYSHEYLSETLGKCSVLHLFAITDKNTHTDFAKLKGWTLQPIKINYCYFLHNSLFKHNEKEWIKQYLTRNSERRIWYGHLQTKIQ